MLVRRGVGGAYATPQLRLPALPSSSQQAAGRGVLPLGWIQELTSNLSRFSSNSVQAPGGSAPRLGRHCRGTAEAIIAAAARTCGGDGQARVCRRRT